MCTGGHGSVLEGAFGAEDGDVCCNWGSSGHWGSEVLATRGGNEDVVGIDGNVLVKRGEEEGIEDFLSYLRGSGRHRCYDPGSSLRKRNDLQGKDGSTSVF